MQDSDEHSKIVSLTIRGMEENEEFQLQNIRTKKDLLLPVQPMSDYKLLKKWTHLQNVPFPKVLSGRPVIVLGEEHAHLIVGRKLVEGPGNAPLASWTRLGWVAHGPNGRRSAIRKSVAMCAVETVDQDAALHELVKQQFRLDSLGVVNCEKLPQSKENNRAEQIMEKTSRRVGDRWETGMLWKSDEMTLPESWTAAMHRLRILERKMDKDANYADLYCGKIEEYLNKGFCRKLSKDEVIFDNGHVWYLPHFGTTNPNKPGKLRLVFDCAAKVNDLCLNDALLQGPDLMSPLINVLLKFRQWEVAFSGDIRDMFHMVNIEVEDSQALRFLWRGKDRNRIPDVYQMSVMVFGAVSSPYQAQWIKNRNALEFTEEAPDAVDAILNRHYVDDYLDSCKSTEEAIEKIMKVREIHRRGGFEIRGWLSNDSDVLKVVAPEEQVEVDKLNLNTDDKVERVLGLFWEPKGDLFKFKTSFHKVDKRILDGEKLPTKREFLRIIMSLFDPLGFISHLTVRGRILMQDIWRNSTEWDQPLKPEQEPKWLKFLEQVKQISEVEIPRCFGPAISNSDDVQLHVMCDASQQAFCAVAYLRVTGRGGISVNIIMAKARVAPLKPMSIPRMELEAALIGARMSSFVKKNLDLSINRTILWSDSRNVICWIRAEDPGRFKIYVAHRIGEILDLTEQRDWKWVPTGENVADDATRDSAAADLSPDSRWFRGPDFLWKLETEWPLEPVAVEKSAKEEDLDIKKVCCMVVMEAQVFPDVHRFSSWLKLTRTTGWILRAKHNLSAKKNKKETRSGILSVVEIREAIKVWTRKCQVDTFMDELEDLREGRYVKKSSRLSGLTPTLVDGIICVNSRLVNSPNIPKSAKCPPILDPRHPWTKLLVAWYHQIFGHLGVEKIFNELRQNYWVLRGVVPVKKAASDCLECKLERAKRIPPQMAALPAVRVTQPKRPFTFVGVDYFGPLDVAVGRKRDKRYGVLFTCLSTRAVHLEVAHSLSTDDFIMALHRFISRRGEPEELWSDNGTNFRGADRELKNALKEMDGAKIGDDLVNRGIKWNFIPPGAPHMGGAWERLVRSVKTAIATVLKNRVLTDQVLLTVMAEAEASVNSRPLTCVSSDKDDPEALTPNNFLIGSTSIKQPPGAFDDGDLTLRKRWRHVQVIANHIWRRWLKEYLPSLALRSKWNADNPDIKFGELVFVPDPNQQRNQWTKGIVVAVHPGPDGRIRVVEVKTISGIFKRPVANLYRIPGWMQDRDSPKLITGRGLLEDDTTCQSST